MYLIRSKSEAIHLRHVMILPKLLCIAICDLDSRPALKYFQHITDIMARRIRLIALMGISEHSTKRAKVVSSSEYLMINIEISSWSCLFNYEEPIYERFLLCILNVKLRITKRTIVGKYLLIVIKFPIVSTLSSPSTFKRLGLIRPLCSI
jgi:hypothetical protein